MEPLEASPKNAPRVYEDDTSQGTRATRRRSVNPSVAVAHTLSLRIYHTRLTRLPYTYSCATPDSLHCCKERDPNTSPGQERPFFETAISREYSEGLEKRPSDFSHQLWTVSERSNKHGKLAHGDRNEYPRHETADQRRK